jgi:hypothetical protein
MVSITWQHANLRQPLRLFFIAFSMASVGCIKLFLVFSGNRCLHLFGCAPFVCFLSWPQHFGHRFMLGIKLAASGVFA